MLLVGMTWNVVTVVMGWLRRDAYTVSILVERVRSGLFLRRTREPVGMSIEHCSARHGG